MDMPPPTITTLAAADVSTSTESSPEEQQSSPSTTNTNKIEYSPIYNTRMKPCKGYETDGLRGYLTLDDLRHDLQLYFYDMNGYSYHRTEAEADNSIAAAAVVTKEAPTGHPSPPLPSMSYRPSIISGSAVPSSSIPSSGRPTTTVTPPNPSPTLRMASPATKSPTLKPVEPSDEKNQLISDQGSVGRKRMRGVVVSSSNNHDGEGEEEEGGSARWRRRLQEVTEDATMMTPATIIPMTSNTVVVASEEYVEVMNQNGQAEVDEIVTNPDNGEEVLIPVTLLPEEGSNTVESTVIDTQQPQQEQGGIHFHICPNTNFQFNNYLYVDVAQELAYLPLVVESPVQQPLFLACLEENTCTFSSGDYHIVFNNNGLLEEDNNLDQSSSSMAHGAITISGINFQQAKESSIVMNDPRGNIIFDKCTWQNNEGGEAATIVIDGKYSSSKNNLEAEYYGVDDYMLPPGKENPFASSTVVEPTTIIPADETTSLVPMEFLFGSTTMAARTTELNMVAMSTEMLSEMGGDNADALGGDGFRLLQETTNAVDEAGVGQSVLGVEPKSLILIRNSTFTGNKGKATIAVDSYPENEGQDSGSTGSIHLDLEGSIFSAERVGTSVILTSGANVSSTGSVFEKNTASSVIQTNLGAISITDTQFTDNVVTGNDGVVVIDSESIVEDNNCVEEPTQIVDEGGTTMASISSRQGDLSARICEGTVVAMGGICLPFGICDPADVEVEVEQEVIESYVEKPIGEAQPEAIKDCHDNWTDLKYAVENRILDGIDIDDLIHIGSLDFKICPNATLDASSGPIVIDYDYVTVQCGNNGLKTDNCDIVGGFVHFHIVGSATDIKLAGLRMSSSKGSSIIAASSKDATLQIRECEWMANSGASAVLIRNNATADADNITGFLDMSSMLDSSEAAMSVEMSGVGFMQNVFNYGTVVNVGGSLTIDTARFNGNEINVGEVAVMKNGELFIRESCFDDSASMMPGTIFIDETSFVQENTNTFGFGNTDGGFDNGLTCTDIFILAVGSDCSSGSNCDGTCFNFTSKSCPLDVNLLPSTSWGTNEIDTSSPGYVRSKNPSDLASIGHRQDIGIVSIIVAFLICAFIVFGLGIIIFKLRRKNTSLIATWQNKWAYVLWIGIYIAVNVEVFALKANEYYDHEEATNLFGQCIVVARGCAEILNLNAMLNLLLMSKHFLTLLRKTPARFAFPFDTTQELHIGIGIVFALLAVSHTCAHICDIYRFAHADEDDIMALFGDRLDPPKSVGGRWAYFLSTRAGVTGILMVLCMIVAYSFAFNRRKHFNRFWYSHHLLLVMLILMCIHGTDQLLEPFETVYWLIGPLVIYFIPRFWRESPLSKLEVKKLAIKKGDVVQLRLQKPKYYDRIVSAGMYGVINIPEISRFEWHPFTLTSSPSDDYIEFHFRKVGRWTQAAHDLLKSKADDKEISGIKDPPIVKVEGPIGASSQGFSDYPVVVLVGAGIGVTPMISVLNELLHNPGKLKRCFFYWTVRDRDSFLWFAELMDRIFEEDEKNILQIRHFLTSVKNDDDRDDLLLGQHIHHQVECGRPDWTKELDSVREEAESIGKYKVGIFLCGPNAMAKSVYDASLDISKKHDPFHMYFTKETF